MTSERTITNSSGRPFLVRVVDKGDRYGLNDALVHDKADPMIEFYDLSQDPAKFGPRGQFVSRYYAATLANHPCGRGIDLLTYVAAWKIDAAALAPVIALARDIFMDDTSPRIAALLEERDAAATIDSIAKAQGWTPETLGRLALDFARDLAGAEFLTYCRRTQAIENRRGADEVDEDAEVLRRAPKGSL